MKRSWQSSVGRGEGGHPQELPEIMWSSLSNVADQEASHPT